VTESLRQIAATTPSLAKKAVQYLNGVVGHCILEGIREDDQTLRLKGVLPSHRGGHVPAVTREQDIGPLVRAIQSYEGFVVRSALLLAAWTALRPGVVASCQRRMKTDPFSVGNVGVILTHPGSYGITP
jgi:hypothetical protein